MSRSGYSDDLDNWAHIRWRGAVAAATRGARGQALLRELLEALDAMEDKRLYPNSFATADGEFCTLGVLGAKRGVKMDDLGDADDGCDTGAVGERFNIPRALAAEIMYENDEGLVDDWIYVDVEICGPMRPYGPDWGRHKKRTLQANPRAAELRWHHMRNWVAQQIKETT